MIHTKSGHFIDVDLLDNNPFVLDFGACQGRFTSEMLYIRPGAFVFAYEPSRRNFDKLKKTKGLLAAFRCAVVGKGYPPLVSFIEYCVKDKSNMLRGFVKGKKAEIKEYPQKTTLVKTVEINTILNRFNALDYVKMDIEGCEYNLVESITDSNFKKISQLSIELHGTNHYKIKEIIAANGFSIIENGKEIFCKRKTQQ